MRAANTCLPEHSSCTKNGGFNLPDKDDVERIVGAAV
jgi:hypothetical protein